MSSINIHVGKMIRKYRKAANLTLQQLADAIHKSRATICKYENGDISMDIETLYEISQVLQVSVPQLTDIGRLQAEADMVKMENELKQKLLEIRKKEIHMANRGRI